NFTPIDGRFHIHHTIPSPRPIFPHKTNGIMYTVWRMDVRIHTNKLIHGNRRKVMGGTWWRRYRIAHGITLDDYLSDGQIIIFKETLAIIIGSCGLLLEV